MKNNNNEKYFMTTLSDSSIGYWEPCKAKTLLGAKREAVKIQGGGLIGDLIVVSVQREGASLNDTIEWTREIV